MQMNAVLYYDLTTKWFRIARPCVIDGKSMQCVIIPGMFVWVLDTGLKLVFPITPIPHTGYIARVVQLNLTIALAEMCNNYGNNYSFSFNTNYIGQMILTPTQVIASWLDEGRTSNLSTVSLTNADWNNCYIFLDSGNRKCYYDWIIVRKYMTTEPTVSIGDEVSGEFYPEGQPDLKDLYGRPPIGARDIGCIEADYPPETGTVMINMRGGFQK